MVQHRQSTMKKKNPEVPEVSHVEQYSCGAGYMSVTAWHICGLSVTYEVIRNRTLEQKNLYVHLMSALTHYLTPTEMIKSDDRHNT